MAAPTLVDYQQSNWADSVSTSEVTPTVTWQAGDFLVVLGATEDNASATLNTPTATGLTFAAVTGTPTNTANQTKLYAWTATAASSSSGAVTGSNSDGTGRARGIAVFVYRGSGGLGNKAVATGLGATTTQSLVRGSSNSAVVQVWGDWSAGTGTTVTWTPSGQTQRIAQFISGVASFFVANWGDQGSPGTTSYGFSGGNGTAFSAITLEITGSTSATSFIVMPTPLAAMIGR
jgi:hypothetical protein